MASTCASKAGERVAIVGQNGSGKSTLVRHFNGLLRPTAGSVTINGRPLGKRHVAELAREVGLAFQNPDRQIFAGKVRAEVAFGPRNLGRRGSELDAGVERGPRDRRADRRRGHEPVRPRLLPSQAARPRLDPRDGDADRYPRRADDRPGREGNQPGAADRRRPVGRGPDHHRDQSRHALRRRVVRARRRHAGRSDRPRRAAADCLRRRNRGRRWPRRTWSRRSPPGSAARLGLGEATPTEAALVSALAAQATGR